MSIIDEILQLRQQVTRTHGEPPDFIVIPFDRMLELQRDMGHSLRAGKPLDRPFAEAIVCGEVTVAQVVVLCGKRWGAGVNVA